MIDMRSLVSSTSHNLVCSLEMIGAKYTLHHCMLVLNHFYRFVFGLRFFKTVLLLSSRLHSRLLFYFEELSSFELIDCEEKTLVVLLILLHCLFKLYLFLFGTHV